MTGKMLGKIESVSFGYLEPWIFGLNLFLSFGSWKTNTGFQYNPEYPKENEALWSVKMISDVQKFLKDAKVNTISELKNKPIEGEFIDSTLKDFRILTEVL
jgi:hypothetical protein